jgi:hypothetical protein
MQKLIEIMSDNDGDLTIHPDEYLSGAEIIAILGSIYHGAVQAYTNRGGIFSPSSSIINNSIGSIIDRYKE